MSDWRTWAETVTAQLREHESSIREISNQVSNWPIVNDKNLNAIYEDLDTLQETSNELRQRLDKLDARISSLYKLRPKRRSNTGRSRSTSKVVSRNHLEQLNEMCAMLEGPPLRQIFSKIYIPLSQIEPFTLRLNQLNSHDYGFWPVVSSCEVKPDYAEFAIVIQASFAEDLLRLSKYIQEIIDDNVVHIIDQKYESTTSSQSDSVLKAAFRYLHNLFTNPGAELFAAIAVILVIFFVVPLLTQIFPR